MSRKLKPKIVELTSDLENWMTNLPENAKTIPLMYLAIPGSHDSFTANISTDSDISPDADEILQTLSFLGPLIKHFIANWSRTQSYMATDQLIRGIRYFDLRIATKEGTQDFFFVHGLYSDNVEEVFNEIAAFLETHPQEVVILDCQHFYAFTDTDHERLMEMFSKIFGSKLLPYSSTMDFITLDYMINQYNYQVIAIYRSDAARSNQPLLWPSASFPNPWPNTTSSTDLITALDRGIQTRRDGIAFVSQCILTPSSSFILSNPFSTLKEKCAVDLDETRLDWIYKQTPGKNGLNIIIADYIELSDCEYVKEVINLNDKLLEKIII